MGSPDVDNVDWPPELSVYKTADTTHYVAATSASAFVCATCLVRFATADRRSLTVEVRVPDRPPPVAGSVHRQFAAEVHHRSCQPPRLSVVRAAAVQGIAADPVYTEVDVHYVLTVDLGPGGHHLPGLVFATSDPVVVRDLEHAEGRSAWISAYLELGFELFSVDQLDWIAAHAPFATTVLGTIDGALFSLTGIVDEQEVTLLEWTRNARHPAYRAWQRAVADSGSLFVLYGEYIHVDPASGAVQLAPGGRLGDISAAVVRVEVVPPRDAGDHPARS